MALMPVADALARILATAKVTSVETLDLKRSPGRVLAKPVRAARNQPPFDASAMDGFALRQEDIAHLPATLKLAGRSAAGHGFRGVVKTGQAVRILTGAPLPRGADTIVIQENTKLDGNLVTVVEPSPLGKNIRRLGLDFAKGDVLLPEGTLLNARDIGLAAAGNAAKIRVRKKPRVALFTTGDELVLPGQKPRADQIVSSNSHALDAMLTAWGAEVINLGIVADTLPATRRAILRGLDADLLVTTGGASVGDTDHVQQALKDCGIHIDFWKIALRPGKPLMFGTKGKTRVIGLPGNPVSALVCSRIFIKPLIDAMLGLSGEAPKTIARLGTALMANDNRQDYIRATLAIGTDGGRTATPFALQDSSMQRNLRNAQCLIVREPFAKASQAGDEVEILILDF